MLSKLLSPPNPRSGTVVKHEQTGMVHNDVAIEATADHCTESHHACHVIYSQFAIDVSTSL